MKTRRRRNSRTLKGAFKARAASRVSGAQNKLGCERSERELRPEDGGPTRTPLILRTNALLLDFLRWRTLRIAGPLRQLAQDTATGPIPVAAAWAAEGLQLLLGVSSAGQNLDPATFSPAAMTADLNSARDALSSVIDNLDIMLDLLAGADEMFRRQ